MLTWGIISTALLLDYDEAEITNGLKHGFPVYSIVRDGFHV